MDLSYIKAKRYEQNNKVGRKEIQAFIGAMDRGRKGVFITTSNFAKGAQEYKKKQHLKHIKLIDGQMLTDLMIKHEVGVDTVKYIII